jgi:D-amino-acid dehydrogenase
MTGRVVVVGGGVVGACSAYYLAKAGWRVTVLDRGEFGRGCSHANCGYACPSHVLPLAVPGAVRSTLKALLARNSALKVRLRTLLGNPGWFLGFARRCNRRDALAAGHAIQALLNSSRALFAELVEKESLACEWEAKGLLFVFRTATALDHFAHTDDLLRSEFDMGARRIDADGLLAMEPALKPGCAGGYLYERDAHLRPDRLMGELRRVLVGLGVEIREHCEVTGLVKEKGVAKAVRARFLPSPLAGEGGGASPPGEGNPPERVKARFPSPGSPAARRPLSQGERVEDIDADQFVIATGAWTPLLNRELGCRVPIQPGKGYSITMPRPAVCPTVPLIFEEHHVAVTPFRSGYRLGSTMEFAGYDVTTNRQRLAILTDAAKLYLRDPLAEPVQEEWWGWRPMTYDGLPIIDRAPAAGNVLIAAGHNMLGLSMAPATGKLVAELLSGDQPHIDPGPYALGRFV